MIDIKNLSFAYHQKRILNNISLEAKSGQFVGILGANGCGKSTLLRNILGFLRFDSGSIRILDREISTYSPKELAKIMSYIPQKSSLSMPMLVRDFILAGRYAKLKNAMFGYESVDYEIVSEIMKKLKLSEYGDRICGSLSGGEFGRVLLARALVNEPKILLLDEPTSAMDLHYAIEILNIVRKCVHNGICAVIVLHDLNLASAFCDEIILMKKGKILSSGSAENLFTEEILAEVYDGLRCEIVRHNGSIFVMPKV